MCIVSAFEELDTDGSGTLDWSELCGVETKLHGFVIDYEEYKKLAASTKGAIGFIEVLRALFPKVPTGVLRAVIKKWGEPHDNRTGYGGDWREVLLPRECDEIQAIYAHFVQGCGQPLTLPLLEQRVSAVSPEDLRDVFAAHDADGDGVLSIDEFASLMDIVYGRKGESHSVKLYFQPEELLKEL